MNTAMEILTILILIISFVAYMEVNVENQVTTKYDKYMGQCEYKSTEFDFINTINLINFESILTLQYFNKFDDINSILLSRISDKVINIFIYDDIGLLIYNNTYLNNSENMYVYSEILEVPLKAYVSTYTYSLVTYKSPPFLTYDEAMQYGEDHKSPFTTVTVDYEIINTKNYTIIMTYV